MSKLFSSLAITISAFPPAAVVIDIANLMSAGIHTAASALDVAGVSFDSLAKMKKTILSSADDFTQMVDSTLNSLDTVKEPSKMLTDQGTSTTPPVTPITPPVTPITPPVTKETPKKEEPVIKAQTPVKAPTTPVKAPAPVKKGGGTIKNIRNQTSRILKSIFDFNQTNKIKKTRRKNHKKYTRKYNK
jgi:outer membrane biosynthesis protein TonB